MSITRKQLTDALRVLGEDPEGVLEAHLYCDRVVVVAYALNEKGHRYVPGDEHSAALVHREIKVTEE